MPTSAYLVVEWTKSAGAELKNPQLEVVATTKVIALRGSAQGNPALMNHKGVFWEGTILSVHGKISVYVPSKRDC